MISHISASRGKVVSIVTISAAMDFLGDGGKRSGGGVQTSIISQWEIRSPG